MHGVFGRFMFGSAAAATLLSFSPSSADFHSPTAQPPLPRSSVIRETFISNASGRTESNSVSTTRPRNVGPAAIARGPSNRAEVAELRKDLKIFVKRSRRGEKAARNTLLVLDALEASSGSDAHRILGQTGVRVSRRGGLSEAGEATVVTEYHLEGRAKLTRVSAFEEARQVTSPVGSQAAIGAVGVSGPSAEALEWQHTLLDCEYTDPDDVYYSGECATQAQIDDWAITYVALSGDSEGVQQDVVYACTTNPQPGCLYDAEEVAPALGGPSALATDCVKTGCVAQGLSYAYSFGVASWRLFKLLQVVNAAFPPAGAGAAAVEAAALATGAFLVAGGGYLYCVYNQ